MRQTLIAGNWKMNKTPDEGVDFINELKANFPETDAEVLITPTAVGIQPMQVAAKGSDIQIGAQNSHFENSGAFTGEISPETLSAMGVPYVIIGHSERREIFHETDEDVNKKAKAILDHGMTPIICVGESLETREEGKDQEWVAGQVKAALKDLSSEDAAKVVLAYEPIWAIGTGKTASADDAEKMIAHIRDILFEAVGEEASQAIRILYGGSVKPANVAELLEKENIDGALVGGASLEVDSYIGLLTGGAK